MVNLMLKNRFSNFPFESQPFIRFNGHFRDLIPQGWRFEKLHRYNRRFYYKSFTELGSGGQCIRIYQRFGGYVVIDGFGEYSHLFAQFLMDDENVQAVKRELEKILSLGLWSKEIISHEFFINFRQNYVLFPTTYEERPNAHLERSTLTEEERKYLRDECYREWTTVSVRQELFNESVNLVRSGLVEIITPDTFS